MLSSGLKKSIKKGRNSHYTSPGVKKESPESPIGLTKLSRKRLSEPYSAKRRVSKGIAFKLVVRLQKKNGIRKKRGINQKVVGFTMKD